MITRRKFVAGITCCAACAAAAGKLAGQTDDATKKENLVAPCGLYCGACRAVLSTQEGNAAPKSGSKMPSMECDGCLGGGRVLAHVTKCAIRECAASKTKSRRCSECAEFPCSRITDFNNDGAQHHSEVLANLRQLRTMGIKDWTKYEEDRWRCPKCQTKLSWYDAECPKCKAPRPDKLFPLKKA